MRMLLCLFVLVATPVWADWVKYIERDGATIYIDNDRVQFSGALRRVRILSDRSVVANSPGGTYSSVIEVAEFDCVRKEYRFIEQTLYSGPMGQGKPVYKPTPKADSHPVHKNNQGAQFALEVACSKQERTVAETKSPSSEDRCASWGLKHGTADYADCQIKLLQVNKGGSSEPARSAPPLQTSIDPPVRTAEQKQRDISRCESWAMMQPNPFTAQVREYRRRLYGSPKSYTYSGSTGYGRITEDPDHSAPWGMQAGAELGTLEAQEQQFVMQAAIQCMQSKGYKPNN